ncbi:C-type lectin domain family 4 member K [Perognathus longimembris pacificus]|uniref:C-type lectin domain family 4 member K n=1 Tax=Perognathus longimembris pacificus TaxID=214514 RepID=UPI0020194AFA|nr:C-type lectin domain family 4 member K [Perognathus longimembris pacificus]
MNATEKEAPDAHFTVDKQNISLWPTETLPKQGPNLVLRKALTVRVVLICLSLIMATSIILQAILYPWFVGTLSDVKNNAQVLKSRVDNVSTLGSEILKNSKDVEAAGSQIQMVHVILNQLNSHILTLETSVDKANTQIQNLTRSWKEVDYLNDQIPELKREFDKASALTAKVRGLQNSLENISKLLKGQNDILQMVSQGWKYFRENFYYFSHSSKTWYSAQQFCVSRNSHLASVTSEGEQEFLYKTADGLPHWIGLTKTGSEGDWSWVDDTPFNSVQSKRFWIPGEPNNLGNNEHCGNIKLFSLRSWNDDSCDNKLLFICKRPYIPSEP